jgi:hypothetical protein
MKKQSLAGGCSGTGILFKVLIKKKEEFAEVNKNMVCGKVQQATSKYNVVYFTSTSYDNVGHGPKTGDLPM